MESWRPVGTPAHNPSSSSFSASNSLGGLSGPAPSLQSHCLGSGQPYTYTQPQTCTKQPTRNPVIWSAAPRYSACCDQLLFKEQMWKPFNDSHQPKVQDNFSTIFPVSPVPEDGCAALLLPVAPPRDEWRGPAWSLGYRLGGFTWKRLREPWHAPSGLRGFLHGRGVKLIRWGSGAQTHGWKPQKGREPHHNLLTQYSEASCFIKSQKSPSRNKNCRYHPTHERK